MEEIIPLIIDYNLKKGRIPCVIEDRFLWITDENKHLINSRCYDADVTFKGLEHQLFCDIVKDETLQFVNFNTNKEGHIEIGVTDLDRFVLTDRAQFEKRLGEVGLVDKLSEWNKNYKGGYENTFTELITLDNKYHVFCCFEDDFRHCLYYEIVYDNLDIQKTNSEFLDCIDHWNDDFQKEIFRWINGKRDCPLTPMDLYYMDYNGFIRKNEIWYETKVKAAQ